MSDDRVETHVVIEDDQGRRAVHFQEYWVRLRAEPAALEIVPIGADEAKPGPGVLEAIATADLVIIPPSNPVVSVGIILAVPGIREAVIESPAPVVGVSPIIGGKPVRGMADKVLAAIGVESSAAAVAEHYGSELLDAWLVDTADSGAVERVEAAGIACRAVPLLMRDAAATEAMAQAALELAAALP
jgi:LPPG:FO 2-phospho-L-lactate transferase